MTKEDLKVLSLCSRQELLECLGELKLKIAQRDQMIDRLQKEKSPDVKILNSLHRIEKLLGNISSKL